jgi:hypothetical protein
MYEAVGYGYLTCRGTFALMPRGVGLESPHLLGPANRNIFVPVLVTVARIESKFSHGCYWSLEWRSAS